MEAVRKGVIPAECSFNGNEGHWWEILYFQASSLEMDAQDWNVMKSFVKQAEIAGVVVPGSCQDLFSARELRKEFENDRCVLTSVLDDLFQYLYALCFFRMRNLRRTYALFTRPPRRSFEYKATKI